MANSYAAANAASDSAFANSMVYGGGLAIWATPSYNRVDVDGQRSGYGDYDGNVGGLTVGLDYTAGDNLRFGIAGHFGTGDLDANDAFGIATSNDIDYIGLSGYFGWSMCNFSLMLDGGYTRVSNDLTQTNALGALNADADVDVWNIGATAEYRFATGALDIIPHIALRYEGINTNSHNVMNAAGALFNIDSDTQHLLTIPVGIRFGKTICTGTWNVTPFVDAGVLFATGDREYTMRYNIAAPGVTRFSSSSRVIDSVSFDGSLGVQMENGKFFGGLEYNLLHSSNATSHALSATVGFNF